MSTRWASAKRLGTASHRHTDEGRTKGSGSSQGAPTPSRPPVPSGPLGVGLGPKITPWTEYHIAKGLEEYRKARVQMEEFASDMGSTRSTGTSLASLSSASQRSTQSAPPVLVPPLGTSPLSTVFDPRVSHSSLPNATSARQRIPRRSPKSNGATKPSADTNAQAKQEDRRKRMDFLRNLYTNGPEERASSEAPFQPGDDTEPAPLPTLGLLSPTSPEYTMYIIAPVPSRLMPAISPGDATTTGPRLITRPTPTGCGPLHQGFPLPALSPAIPHAAQDVTRCDVNHSALSSVQILPTVTEGSLLPTMVREKPTAPPTRDEGIPTTCTSPKMDSTLGEEDVDALIRWTQQLDIPESWAI